MRISLLFVLCCSVLWNTSIAQHLEGIPDSDFNVFITNTGQQFKHYSSREFTQSQSRNSSIDPVLADSLQAVLDRTQTNLDAVGLSAAVNLGNGDIWVGTAGISSAGQSLNADHVFPMGSVSKTITSACILLMEKADMLSLEDTIGTWITGYPEIDGNIKVYQLLNHSSGIFNYTNHANFATIINNNLSTIWSKEDMLDQFLDEPYFAPGEGWEYSNTNYILLGIIIESLSGKTYHEAVREWVLEPNGFDEIVLLPQERPNGDIAHIWQGIPKQDLFSLGIPLDGLYSGASSAGAYAATPSLLSEWIRQLYGGQILGDDYTTRLYDYNVDLGNNIAYGMGVIIDTDDNFFGHGGDIIYGTQAFYQSDKDVSVVLQTNDGNLGSGVLNNPMVDLFFECEEYEQTVSAKEIVQQEGLTVYPNPSSQEVFIKIENSVSQDIDVLLYNSLGQQVYESPAQLFNQAMISIPLSNLENGIYVLMVKMNDKVMTEVLIKE